MSTLEKLRADMFAAFERLETVERAHAEARKRRQEANGTEFEPSLDAEWKAWEAAHWEWSCKAADYANAAPGDDELAQLIIAQSDAGGDLMAVMSEWDWSVEASETGAITAVIRNGPSPDALKAAVRRAMDHRR